MSAEMMSTITRLQDEWMHLMSRVEEPVVRGTGRVAESVAEYVPERPSWSFLDRLPTVTELVDNQLKFRRRVVDEQAAFVRRMMKAARPALARIEPAPAPRAARAASGRRPAKAA